MAERIGDSSASIGDILGVNPQRDPAPNAPPTDTPPPPPSGTKPPPRRRPKAKPKADAGSSDKPSLVEPLTDFFATAATFSYMACQYCGQNAIEAAPDLAQSLNKAAQQNDTLHNVLSKLVETGVWAAVATAVARVVIPPLAHHGPLPGAAALLVGAPPPPANGHDKEAADAVAHLLSNAADAAGRPHRPNTDARGSGNDGSPS